MDKNAIKKFAVWARTELIARVSLKGVEYGITEDNIEDANADSVKDISRSWKRLPILGSIAFLLCDSWK